MANLFGNVHFNTELPQDSPSMTTREAMASGMALGKNFLEGYYRSKEQAIEENRWRAGQALRDAQLSEANFKLQELQEATNIRQSRLAARPGLRKLAADAAKMNWDTRAEVNYRNYLVSNAHLADDPVAH